MKSIYLLLLLSLFSIKLKSQAVLDAAFVSERFQVYNGLINYKLWGISDFLIMNKNAFKLSNDEIEELKATNINQLEANYLFQEDNHWVKRLFRNVELSNPTNKGFEMLNGNSNPIQEELYNSIVKDEIYLFKQEEFIDVLSPEDIDLQFLKTKVVGFKIKEDWAYNKFASKLECHIIGFAPIVEVEGSKKELFWVYYPDFKNHCNSKSIGRPFFHRLKERKFHGSVYKTSNMTLQNLIKDRTYQNDLDAWVNIQLLKEELSLNSTIYKSEGKFKIKDSKNGTIKGNIENHKLTGELIWKYPNGKTKLLTSYSNGAIHGDYFFYYEIGEIMEEGIFENGVRVKTWNSYFRNGKLASSKNFENGFLDGNQKYFYDNGNLREDYHFENNSLNGPYSSFYKDGSLKAKGLVKKGIIQGNWNYLIQLNPLVSRVIKRNTNFYDQNFVFEKKWKSIFLIDGLLDLTIKYELENSDRCLNNLCNNMNIISVK